MQGIELIGTLSMGKAEVLFHHKLKVLPVIEGAFVLHLGPAKGTQYNGSKVSNSLHGYGGRGDVTMQARNGRFYFKPKCM